VMGAKALQSLITRYAAFSGQRIVVLGSNDFAASTALLAARHGIQVAALVEVLPQAQTSASQKTELAAAGIPILTRHVPKRALGGIEGVERLVLEDADGREIEITCDTVCFALGAISSIELLQAAGGRIVAETDHGGYAPALRGWETSIPNVYAAGSCVGSCNGSEDSIEQGRQAVRQSLRKELGTVLRARVDTWAYQSAWFDALTRKGDDSVVVCQCEAVTRGDLLEVRAPRYLGPAFPKSMNRNIQTLLADGPLDQDQIKRLTRACMGVCQARRCREQVALTLAQAACLPLTSVPLAGYRPPVRPLPLRVVADSRETQAMATNWEPWFDIRGQWAAYDDIGTEREFEGPFGGTSS